LQVPFEKIYHQAQASWVLNDKTGELEATFERRPYGNIGRNDWYHIATGKPRRQYEKEEREKDERALPTWEQYPSLVASREKRYREW